MPKYTPNSIPVGTRVAHILLSALLLTYGTLAIYFDDLYLPASGRRLHHHGIHFHGVPLWLTYAAMLCAVLSLLSVVADHYDKRDNEISYRRFAAGCQLLGYILFLAGLSLEVFALHQATL